MSRLVSSESVTNGHPDKICDQISDAILTEILKVDKYARVAVETFVTTGLVTIMGEVSTKKYANIEQIVRNTIKDIGYNSSKVGFDYESCGVIVNLEEQSADIARGVDIAEKGGDPLNDLGAGDQGIMFGYACNETDELFPLAPKIANDLAFRLTEVREKKIVPNLRPDGKTQVTLEYENGKAKALSAIVISAHHNNKVTQEDLKRSILAEVVAPVIKKYHFEKDNFKFYFNPTGKFEIGGPKGDTGLTGRKIIVDTYGGVAHHGGGAFSGKDPSKVDRSASYALRWVAKNVIAAGFADKVELQISYAIGVPAPVSLNIDTFQTGKISEDKILAAVQSVFDLRPAAIIRDLDLLTVDYRKTSVFGHFGRSDTNFPWEQTNRVNELKAAVKLLAVK